MIGILNFGFYIFVYEDIYQICFGTGGYRYHGTQLL